MKLLLTGACGFAGSTIAETLLAASGGLEIVGVDNFIRPGSESNRQRLQALGVKLVHADIRSASDVAVLPAAEGSRLAANQRAAGVDGRPQPSTSRTPRRPINLLAYARSRRFYSPQHPRSIHRVAGC